MTLPVAKAEHRADRLPDLTGQVLPLPDQALVLAPDPVRYASQRHREALARLARLQAEQKQAGVVAEEASQVACDSARESVEAGRTPPKFKAPGARERVAVAAAAVEAAT